MTVLHALSYVAIVAAFAFVTLSLASGLLYISELIEEHSRPAKVIGQRGIYTIIVLHFVLYLTDSFPFLRILFSASCHVVYLQNFSSSWPMISLSSVSFISSCALAIVDHFLWFSYFSHAVRESRRYHHHFSLPPAPSFLDIATFFGVCVWLAPLFLFLSLSANDNALPTSGSGRDTSPTAAGFPVKQGRTPLFKTLIDYVPDVFPRVRSNLLRHKTEGLIAPQSPRRATSSHAESPPHALNNPPLSPMTFDSTGWSSAKRRQGELFEHRLSTPPRRSSSMQPQ